MAPNTCEDTNACEDTDTNALLLYQIGRLLHTSDT